MKKVLLLLLLCLFGNSYSYAQLLHGLDPTFANNGIYVGDTGGIVQMKELPDKKILATCGEVKNASQRYLTKRYNDNGVIDHSFATNGEYIPTLPNITNALATAICIQPDGRMLLGRQADNNLLVIRLKQDGSYDSSFGNNGVSIAGSGGEYIKSITLQLDGKIVVCGERYTDNTVLVARYQANGSLDSFFGINGIVRSGWNDWGFTYPSANDIAVMSDGRIVIGADAKIDALSGAVAFVAIRLLPNGNLDSTFNQNGIAYSNNHLSWLPYSKAMRLQPDGKVLLGGYDDSIVVMRFDTTGLLDTNFGNRGIVKINGGNDVRYTTMDLQQNGNILISGQVNGINYLYRRNPDGTPDLSFGINGELTCHGFSINSIITLQDSKILVGGMLNRKLSIARLTPTATQILNVNNNELIEISPNPATDIIYFDVTDNQRIQQVSIHSIDGKLLYTQTHLNNNRLSTESLADGIYYLYIRLADHTLLTKKILIQKN